MSCVYINLFAFRMKSVSDGGTDHAGRPETTQCSSYVQQSGESNKYRFHAIERAVLFTFTLHFSNLMVIIFFWVSLWKAARRDNRKIYFCIFCPTLMALCTVQLDHLHLHQLMMSYEVSLMKMYIELS